jgi:hypothetical protein
MDAAELNLAATVTGGAGRMTGERTSGRLLSSPGIRRKR